MANPGDANQISLPYLLLVVIIAGAILRFLFFSSNSDSSAATQRHNPLNVLRTREAAVERIQQMFPQVDRRTILWDLQRNGGNIQATSERILSGQIERVCFPLLRTRSFRAVPGLSAAQMRANTGRQGQIDHRADSLHSLP